MRHNYIKHKGVKDYPYKLLTATPTGGQWSALCPDHFTAGGSNRDCDRIGGCWAVETVCTGGEEKLDPSFT
jgi:hypothetical protein